MRYVWKDGTFRNRHTGEEMDLPYKGKICRPSVRGDLPTYISPVTRKPVDGRAARREDLKRADCREVDPSEFKPQYRNRETAIRNGGEHKWNPEAGSTPRKYSGFLA